MIFSRRAIQTRLDALRQKMDGKVVDGLVAKLNGPKDGRLGAMWEVVVLEALAQGGSVQSELPLETGRCPDVQFNGAGGAFVADVTCVSDDGIVEQNPIDLFMEMVEAAKTKMGMPIGGCTFKFGTAFRPRGKGTQMVAHLPKKSEIGAFVKDRVAPQVREQLRQGQDVIHIAFDEPAAKVEITIDPKKSPMTLAENIGFTNPQSLTRNPLYNRLVEKAGQLSGAAGLSGIIIADAGSQSLVMPRAVNPSAQPKTIIAEFFRRRSSIDFVLVLCVEQDLRVRTTNLVHRVRPYLFVRDQAQFPAELRILLEGLGDLMPTPVRDAKNGAWLAKSEPFDFGFEWTHGLGRDYIKIGARDLAEVLAGRKSVQQLNVNHHWYGSKDQVQEGHHLNPFEMMLDEGRLPVAITVEPSVENQGDDWVTIRFGDPDPAISAFK